MDKEHHILPLYFNSVAMICLAIYLCFIPFVSIINQVHQITRAGEGISPFTYRWHQALSKDFQGWAEERVASGKAGKLNVNNISGTEWPMFSAVFYLWATEALQDAWSVDPRLYEESPAEYAGGAIEAAIALITDPNHAHWVQIHWGADYLSRQNLFYRMLLIHGMVSYQKLTGNDTYEDFLRDQVESLAREIDSSPYGLLEDYPGQCYPVDVVPAIAAIRRADEVLGTDHSAFVSRAARGFQGDFLDPLTQLPTYTAVLSQGKGTGSSRGVGVVYMLTWSPELWPEENAAWYASFLDHFWQQNWLIAGFREFPREKNLPEWFFLDVDAGPVLAGYGTAASAFGIGAARANGDLERAIPLTAEALVASWPLLDQTRLSARLLSNLSDAPYTGETALLFTLTRIPSSSTTEIGRVGLPFIYYFGLSIYLEAGLLLVVIALKRIRQWPETSSQFKPGELSSQFNLWLFVLFAGCVVLVINPLLGAICLGISLAFPSRKLMHQPPEGSRN